MASWFELPPTKWLYILENIAAGFWSWESFLLVLASDVFYVRFVSVLPPCVLVSVYVFTVICTRSVYSLPNMSRHVFELSSCRDVWVSVLLLGQCQLCAGFIGWLQLEVQEL